MGKQRHKKHSRKRNRPRSRQGLEALDLSRLHHTDNDDCPVCAALASRPPTHELPGGFTAHALDDDLMALLLSLMTPARQAS